MKKKSSPQSAFFNPRVLLGLALCFVGVICASLALTGLSGSSLLAQGVSPKSLPAVVDPNPSAPAPTDLRPVRVVHSRALRLQPVIQPEMAPGHDHAEPMQPEPPTEGAGPDTVRQSKMGPISSAPVPTSTSFDGVGVGLAGFAPSSNPPDVNGRVGATQYVQWNNTSFAVFNKSTGALLYGPAAGNTLFQSLGGVCASHNDGDPVVSYDLLAGRWILSQFVVSGPAGSASHQCVAVSATGDATGEYYLYDFLTDATNFVDYPHMGVWPDGYYMSAHVFNAAGTAVVAARVYVFERAAMIAGLPARQVSANLAKFGTSFQYGFLPADLDSLTPPPVGEASFVLGPHPTNLGLTASTRVAVTWGATPTITLTQATIATTAYTTASCVSTGRLCVPQPAPALTSDSLDNIKSHFMYRLAYRNNGTQAAPQESLIANIPVGSVVPSAHDAIRWYEFRNAGDSLATPTVFQQSTFDPDATYRWLGSAAMDKDQNIALGYSKSSTSVIPAIWITGRLGTDAVNTMGAEIQMTAGGGVQTAGAGNRWGDYSAMTLDPVDQCTFYYTNEYLRANGTFNWSTRVAAFRFPSCSDAPAWGTVTGTVTSTTGAPVSGVTVKLDNGYAGASDASGVYSILVPAGSYSASASDLNRNCSVATPGSVPVTVAVGGSTTQNFTITGSSKLEANGLTINDSANGNGNGIVNKAECVLLNAAIKNNGCATESAISATLTTTTAGVTVVDGNAAYPDLAIDASGTNNVPFKVSTSDTFVCGTNIALSLNLTFASGSKTIAFSVPTCGGGASQSIPSSQILLTDPTQTDRLARNGVPSTCAGKVSPGGIGTAGTRNYKQFSFTNTAGAPVCITTAITAALGGQGDIEAVAYLNSYDPTQQSLNYLGDSGISGLGTTVSNASFAFTVPAMSNFVIVIETATGSTTSSTFSGTVSGFYDQTPGPGACPATPTAPNLVSVVSRMSNVAGTFDTNIPLSSPLGVEDRNGAGNYTLVFTFDAPVQSGSATVSGTATTGTATFTGNQMTVPLTGVADQQTLAVTAMNVTGTNGGILSSTSVNVGFLIGDTNGDGAVSSSDIGQTKSQAGNTVTNSNFRLDVNNNGVINGSDVSQVKSNSGHSL
ncbi:MAG: carboxypeptidase regulatory-like domain-containing protein [Chthoniobacterales bacterium]